MSGFYQKASLDLLYDLINRDNPTLPYKVSKDTFTLHSGPTVLVPANNNGYNTQVIMRGIQGAGYRGLVTFRYNRIDFAQLFKDVDVTITHYTATGIQTALAMFNAVYGLALVASEMNAVTWTNSSSSTTATLTTVAVASATASLAFIGTIPKFVWKRGTPSLETLVTKMESTLPSLATPAANKYDMSGIYRGMDFTDIKTQISNVLSQNNVGSWQALAAALAKATGDPWVYSGGTVGFNLYSASAANISVPAADAADRYYTDCNTIFRIALTSSSNNTVDLGGGWGIQLLLPYNA